MKQTRVMDGFVYFDFICPGCDAEGDLGIDPNDGMKSFGCPEGCGSVFVPWQPNGSDWELKCVVQPVEARPEPIPETEHAEESAKEAGEAQRSKTA